MAPHSSTLAWKIPWTEEPGGLQSMGSLRVAHDWATSLSFSLSCIGEGNGNPLQCSCLENPRDGGAWSAAVYGVAQSWTWLRQLSSGSSKQQIIVANILNSCLYQQKGGGGTQSIIQKILHNQNWNWSNRTKYWNEITFGLTISHEMNVSRERDSQCGRRAI